MGESMRRVVYASVKQAISDKGFCLGVLGVVLIIFVSSMQDIVTAFRAKELLSYGFHNTLLTNALTSDAMTLVLPIFAALPFTASFVDDVKSGFMKEYLPRTGIRKYVVGKCSACVISGGLVFVCGILIAYMMAALIFTPMEAAPALRAAGAPPEEELVLSYIAELMRRVVLYFCSGAFWSMTGMLFAALTTSKYMAYASPFVFYYVLIILYERYFDTLYVLYPKEWIIPSERWEYGEVGVIVFVAELTMIAALCFGMTAERRLSRI